MAERSRARVRNRFGPGGREVETRPRRRESFERKPRLEGEAQQDNEKEGLTAGKKINNEEKKKKNINRLRKRKETREEHEGEQADAGSSHRGATLGRLRDGKPGLVPPGPAASGQGRQPP